MLNEDAFGGDEYPGGRISSSDRGRNRISRVGTALPCEGRAVVSKRGVDDGNQKGGGFLQPAQESHHHYNNIFSNVKKNLYFFENFLSDVLSIGCDHFFAFFIRRPCLISMKPLGIFDINRISGSDRTES